MKTREFGTWQPRNVFGPERQKLYDEYNRRFKKERNAQPMEFASSDVEEYYRVPESKDMSEYQGQQREKTSQGKRKNDSHSMQRTMLRQAVGMLAGATVVVTTYQTVVANQPAEAPPAPPQQSENVTPGDDTRPNPPVDSAEPDVLPDHEEEAAEPVLTPSWAWSEDGKTATLVLTDEEGNVAKRITATITEEEDYASCTRDGLITRTALVLDGEDAYTDVQTEEVPAKGHDLDEGVESHSDNGETTVTFTCRRCRQEFVFVTSATENE